MGFLQKRELAPVAESSGSAFVVSPGADLEWAALVEFLAAESWPDGSVRQTGTVLLFVDEGRLKVCLSDRGQGLVGFLSGSSILDALRNAEQGLREDSISWRPARGNAKRRNR